jgi:putative endonuclease
VNIQKKIGDLGESIAQDYLIELGYIIVETNWRYSKSEIDLIVKDKDTLVFVEVKTRSYDYYGQPEDSIDAKKELMITEGAAAYMRSVGHEWTFRFDIISIILPKSGQPTIRHYQDAFFPGLI